MDTVQSARVAKLAHRCCCQMDIEPVGSSVPSTQHRPPPKEAHAQTPGSRGQPLSPNPAGFCALPVSVPKIPVSVPSFPSSLISWHFLAFLVISWHFLGFPL